MSIKFTSERERIISDVLDERARQDVLKRAGKFLFTCADSELLQSERFLILAEEVGEVARAILNQAKLSNDQVRDLPGSLRRELIQVMAVALAWVEALDDAERQPMMAVDSTVQERENSG